MNYELWISNYLDNLLFPNDHTPRGPNTEVNPSIHLTSFEIRTEKIFQYKINTNSNVHCQSCFAIILLQGNQERWNYHLTEIDKISPNAPISTSTKHCPVKFLNKAASGLMSYVITTRQIDQTYTIYNIDQADQNFKFIRILTIIVNQKEPADKKSLLSKISDGKYNSSPKNISYKNISI